MIEKKVYSGTNEELETIEGVRNFFIDPHRETPSELIRLSQQAIHVMQQIYSTGGRIDLMDIRTQNWLSQSLGQSTLGNLDVVVGQILAAETSTRRFDNKFFGQIHPQGSEVGILANLIAAYMNTNTIVKEVSIAENAMEAEVLAWFADWFDFDKREFSGNITTGGTLANQAALWAARDWKINGLKEEGRWSPGRKLYVLGSDMVHYSIVKICYQLGTENVIFVKTKSKNFKTDPEEIEKAISRLDLENGSVMAIVGLAGETETGMVDDLNSLSDLAEKYNAHFHVDAAYGGPFILSKAHNLFNGISRADTITIDPHKMLYTPYAAGAVLFRDKMRHILIERGMREEAGYQSPREVRERLDLRDEQRNFGFSRVEGSMGSGGVIATWATKRLFGEDGIATLLNHTIELTNHAYQRTLRSGILTPLHQPETNTLLIGLRDSELSEAVNRELVETTKARIELQEGYYISTDDKITGLPIFRFVAMHPYSTSKEVDCLLDLLEREIRERLC